MTNILAQVKGKESLLLGIGLIVILSALLFTNVITIPNLTGGTTLPYTHSNSAEILDISTIKYFTSAEADDSVDIARVEVLLNGQDDWAIGDTVYTDEDDFTAKTVNVEGTSTKPKEKFALGVKLDGNGYKYTYAVAGSSYDLVDYDITYKDVTLNSANWGGTCGTYLLGGAHTYSGGVPASLNGALGDCKPYYNSVCYANGGTMIEYKANSNTWICAKVYEKSRDTIFTGKDGYYFTKITGTAYINGLAKDSFTIDSTSDKIVQANKVTIDENGETTVGGTIIRKASLLGGFVNYASSFALPGSDLNFFYDSTLGKNRFINTNAWIAYTGKTKPSLAYGTSKTLTDIQTEIVDYRTTMQKCKTLEPVQQLLSSSEQSRVSSGVLYFDRDVSGAIPVLTIDLNAKNVGIYTPVAIASLKCPTTTLNSIENDVDSVTITATNTGDTGAVTVSFINCDLVTPSGTTSKTLTVNGNGGITPFTFNILSTEPGKSTCSAKAVNGIGATTGTCTFNTEVVELCKQTTPPTAGEWTWYGQGEGCTWKCDLTNCQANYYPDTSKTCTCVPYEQGKDCTTKPQYSVYTGTGKQPDCAWNCNGGYHESFNNTLQQSVCVKDTEEEDTSCKAGIIAKYATPCGSLDLLCGPTRAITKPIDEAGCAIQDLLSNLLWIAVGFMVIVVVGLGAYLVFFKGKGKVKVKK